MSCIYFICMYKQHRVYTSCVCRASLRCSLLFLVYNKCTILSHLIFNSLTSSSFSSSSSLSFCIKTSVSCAISFAHADTHLHFAFATKELLCVSFFQLPSVVPTIVRTPKIWMDVCAWVFGLRARHSE